MYGRNALAPDVDLVDLARQGDHEAFTALYEQHAPAVRRVAAGYVRQPEIVSDIVQDTFMRALEHIGDLRQNDRFRPWLLSIARHTAINHGRRASRETGLDTDSADQLPDRELGPDASLEVAELARQVSSSMAGLSRRDSTAIALVTYLGLGPSEVAAALGITPGAAKVVVHRARRRLRTAFSLQLLRAQPGLACPEMRAVLADTGQATHHVENCVECLAAASDEVIAFDMSTVGGQSHTAAASPPHPPTV